MALLAAIFFFIHVCVWQRSLDPDLCLCLLSVLRVPLSVGTTVFAIHYLGWMVFSSMPFVTLHVRAVLGGWFAQTHVSDWHRFQHSHVSFYLVPVLFVGFW